LIQEIGSYAGFAAILGLAVLSALYFSQSRDVKRLREWAGRAPERDAEARSRVAAATNLRQTPAAQAQQGQVAATAAKPAAAAASGNSGSASQAAPAKDGAAAGSVAAVGAGGAAGGSGRGAVASPARPARVSAQTSILKPEDRPRERWYRTPRYIALLVAGVLVVGGGIAVGVLQLLGNGGGGGGGATNQPTATRQGSEPELSKQKPIQAGDINVTVLNATGVQGLAQTYGAKVQAEGFVKGSVGNYTGAPRAESVVMYAPGKKREARFVGRRFGISAIAAEDANARKVAPSADIVLVMGTDKQGG
jgi:hypothetical protein